MMMTEFSASPRVMVKKRLSYELLLDADDPLECYGLPFPPRILYKYRKRRNLNPRCRNRIRVRQAARPVRDLRTWRRTLCIRCNKCRSCNSSGSICDCRRSRKAAVVVEPRLRMRRLLVRRRHQRRKIHLPPAMRHWESPSQKT